MKKKWKRLTGCMYTECYESNETCEFDELQGLQYIERDTTLPILVTFQVLCALCIFLHKQTKKRVAWYVLKNM